MNAFSPSEEKRRLALAAAIADSWNVLNVDYAVVHGLQYWPSRIGRDIDVACRQVDIPVLFESAVAIGASFGFSTVLSRWSHWGLFQCVLIDADGGVSLALDLLCTTDVWRAKIIPLVSSSMLDGIAIGDDWRGPFRVSIAGTFLKSCVRSILCGQSASVRAEWGLPVRIPETVDARHVRRVLGARGCRLLSIDDPFRFERSVHREMLMIQLTWAIRHPFQSCGSIISAMRSKIRRSIYNGATVIRVDVPDAAALAEVFPQLRSDLRRLFIDVRVLNVSDWSPSLVWWRVVRLRTPPVSEWIVYLCVTDTQTSLNAGRSRSAAVHRLKMSAFDDTWIFNDLDAVNRLDAFRVAAKSATLRVLTKERHS